MAGFLKLGSIQGEATEKSHQNWILFESMSAPIYRNIPAGAKDNERTRGATTLGDVVVVRQLDKSSVQIQEYCAKGTPIDKVEIHLCVQADDKAAPYLKYELENVIITSYSFHGRSEGDKPTEELTLNYTKVKWIYVNVDPKTLKSGAEVPASFDLGKHAAK